MNPPTTKPISSHIERLPGHAWSLLFSNGECLLYFPTTAQAYEFLTQMFRPPMILGEGELHLVMASDTEDGHPLIYQITAIHPPSQDDLQKGYSMVNLWGAPYDRYKQFVESKWPSIRRAIPAC